MPRFLDLSGKRFGKLVVAHRDGMLSPVRWICNCDCGKSVSVSSGNIQRGTASCGCYSAEVSGNRFRTHGETGSKEYRSWKLMKRRCTDKNWHMYARYGGAGVGICDEWLTFENFLRDMGKAPSDKHTIDRIDNQKGYSKLNCRWATPTQQSRNRSVTKMTIEKAEIVHKLRSNGMLISKIAETLDLPKYCVEDVLRGRTFVESKSADNLTT